jgi:hypothetical protein
MYVCMCIYIYIYISEVISKYSNCHSHRREPQKSQLYIYLNLVLRIIVSRRIILPACNTDDKSPLVYIRCNQCTHTYTYTKIPFTNPASQLATEYVPLYKTTKASLIFDFFIWRNNPQWVRASTFTRFLDHTQRRTKVGRTPLDEWSARRRNLCLTTHNTHDRQTSMPPLEFEPAFSAGERPLGQAWCLIVINIIILKELPWKV